jgi:hypothetical protein
MRLDAQSSINELQAAADDQGLIRVGNLSADHRALLFGPDAEVDDDEQLELAQVQTWIEQGRNDTFREDRPRSKFVRAVTFGMIPGTGEMEPDALTRAAHRSPRASYFIHFTQRDPELKTSALSAATRAERLADHDSAAFRRSNGRPGVMLFSGYPASSTDFPKRIGTTFFRPTRADGSKLGMLAESTFGAMQARSPGAHQYAKRIRFGPDAITNFALAAMETASSFYLRSEDQLQVARFAEDVAVRALEHVSGSGGQTLKGSLFVGYLTSFLGRMAQTLTELDDRGETPKAMDSLGRGGEPWTHLENELRRQLKAQILAG